MDDDPLLKIVFSTIIGLVVAAILIRFFVVGNGWSPGQALFGV